MKNDLSYLTAIYNANLDFFAGNVLEGILQGKSSLYNSLHYLECMLQLGWKGNNINISYIKPLLKNYKDTPTEDLLNAYIGVLEANLYGKNKREAAIKDLISALQLEIHSLFLQ